MDTKALLRDDSQDEMYYDEVSTSEDGLPEKGMTKMIPGSSKFKQFLTPVLLCGSMTVVYSLILVAVVLKMQALRLQGPRLIQCKFLKFCSVHVANAIAAPARNAVQYEAHIFDMDPSIESPYFGEPSDKLDEAWNDLLQCEKAKTSIQ
jgi:hypothetical protein